MDLRQLRYFVQVAQRQNFRRAGVDLRIAQSALTRHIKNLEGELDLLLFDRVSGRVSLTPAGRRLLERSQHILGEVDRLAEDVRTGADVPSGLVSLAAPPSIGRLLFSRIAGKFLKTYPRVTLSLVESWTANALGQLKRNEINLAIVSDPPPDPALVYTHLFSEALYLVGDPDDARLKRRDISLRQLADFPLALTSRSNQSRQVLEMAAAQEGVALNVCLELESPTTLRQVLRNGAIYALVPHSSISLEAQANRLGAVPVKGLSMARYLAESREGGKSAAIKVLTETVLTEMETLHARTGGKRKSRRPPLTQPA